MNLKGTKPTRNEGFDNFLSLRLYFDLAQFHKMHPLQLNPLFLDEKELGWSTFHNLRCYFFHSHNEVEIF
jgi:hypothetical protein